jgi:hypothetical protein
MAQTGQTSRMERNRIRKAENLCMGRKSFADLNGMITDDCC